MTGHLGPSRPMAETSLHVTYCVAPPPPGAGEPGWSTCSGEPECIGVRVAPYDRCLAHLDKAERDEVLSKLSPGADVDGRGTLFTAQLLGEVLEAVKNPEAGNSSFGDARFDRAEFSGDARFDGARFGRAAEFGDAKFSEAAGFDGAKFTGITDFAETDFRGKASFAGAMVGDGCRVGRCYSHDLWNQVPSQVTEYFTFSMPLLRSRFTAQAQCERWTRF